MSSRVVPTHDSINAKVNRAMHPHTGFCGRCGYTWRVVDGHTTWHSKDKGCFPLCKGCWQLLGAPEARIEYYRDLIDHWERAGSDISEDTKRDIQRAVANGG